jgi:hypothetical protein
MSDVLGRRIKTVCVLFIFPGEGVEGWWVKGVRVILGEYWAGFLLGF